MSKMIGQTLVEKGLISSEQLGKVLSAQLVHGGHLGTCMIELGYVSEDCLGETLSEILEVDYAKPREFVGLPDHVIRAIPRQLVEKHRVIPIGKTDRTLRVAMINPQDLQSLDDLTFGTGCNIEPCLAPEVRIRHAMEAYYGIERSRRFITLSALIDEVALLRERVVMAAAREARPIDREQALASPVGFDYEPSATAPSGSPPGNDLRELLCGADSKEMLARAVLDHAALGADRCILFLVKRCTVRLWDWIGCEPAPEAVSGLEIELTSEPLFTLLAGNDLFRGPVPDEPRFRQLYARLGIDPPAELLLLPVRLNDCLVAILCCDGGRDGPIRGETETYVELAQKFQIAMHMVVLKNRIRSG